MKSLKLTLIIIVFITILAGIFVWQPRFREWRLGLDLQGGVRLTYDIDLSQIKIQERKSVVGGLREVIEKRVNLFGVAEPQVYSSFKKDSYRLIVELAGIKDIQEAVDEIGKTPQLDFREVKIIETKSESTSTITQATSSYVFIPTELTGRYVTGAYVDTSSIKPAVNIEFNKAGAKMFAELTKKNVGKPLAIFLDNRLIEMPTVREEILGGKAQISGDFTLDSAKRLVQRFNAGALPAPIKLVNQQRVGASLGEGSLNKMIKAGILGFILVILFMIIYYGKLGLVSAIALVIYVVLVLAIYKVIPITLTLSGIGGFILSIGIAVDANVLIFERIKEELKKGSKYSLAIESGFKRAWPAIRDANITTILIALIMFYFTSSFIKGFALALLLGVLISMFSAIFVTRIILKVIYE